MAEPSLLELFVRPLAASGIKYFVTGGVATIVYGEPRFTRDIDLVLAVRPSSADSFLELWRVIARKLSYFAQSGSTRHLEDIARIRRVQEDRIDQPALDEWIRTLGLDGVWRQALAIDLDRT